MNLIGGKVVTIIKEPLFGLYVSSHKSQYSVATPSEV